MNKAGLLKAVNPILFISAVVQIFTGVALSLHLFTPQLQTIAEVHEHNGFLLAALIITHLYLNWGWVKSLFPGRHG